MQSGGGGGVSAFAPAPPSVGDGGGGGGFLRVGKDGLSFLFHYILLF